METVSGIALIVLVLALLAVLSWAFIQFRAVRRSSAAYRQVVMKLEAASDAERARLSGELHDDVGQKLAVLKIQLQLAQRAGHTSIVESSQGCIAIVDGLLADVRSLAHALRPAPFEEGQLIPALTALARAEGRRAGFCVLVDAPTDDVALSREAELTCYRIVREALNNVVKHARARHVAVAALREGHSLALMIADDGRGFDLGPATRRALVDGHLGLVGMRERLAQIGGRLTIRSQRGVGTTVECRVPLTAMP